MDLREQVESYMKIFGEDVNLETKLTRDLLSQNEKLKEFTDKHMHTRKYFNGFFKCEDDECICGKIHSPPQIFEKMKSEGILLPVETNSRIGKKYLPYEDTITHPNRNEERLPSLGGRRIEEPPFKLSAKTARLTITCANKTCQKKRIVYKKTRPTKDELETFKEGIEDFAWTCGDRIDDTKTWMVNEKMNCKDTIETVYYSSMVDGTQNAENQLLCYGCGKTLDSTVLEKYIEDKKVHTQVKPTCTPIKCAIRKTFKWHLGKKRKVDKVWKANHLVNRKLTALKRLEDAKKRAEENNQN